MAKLHQGNLAIVEGAIAGGLDAYFGYPITPQNEITEHMSLRMKEEGRVFLQSESETAAISMVFGTALTGKKAMTTSSSPGISLMQEGISYLVGCELPAVIVNVQRGGPGLGNIAGAQGDYFQAVKGGGHGDYKLIVFTPATVQEMYEMTRDSFDISIKYRNPVMILTDGVIGQIMEPADFSHKKKFPKTKETDLKWTLTGCAGRDPRFIRSLMLGEKELENHNYKLFEKYLSMEEELTSWEEKNVNNADVVLVGYGTSARINYDVYTEAKKQDWKVGYFRMKTVFPFPSNRIKEIALRSKLLVIEMSMGQMLEDVQLAVDDKTRVSFYGRPAGGLPEKEKILQILKEMLQKNDK